MDTFSTLYSRLNPAQKLAVDTIEGPVMVIAGPGTGKTTILTLRIANILKTTDTPPSGILAITFTDAGVKAMKEKLRNIIGSRADEVRIHTFHGFATSIIAEFPEHFAAIDGFTQMSDIETDELIRSILEADQFSALRPLGKPDLYIHPIVSAMSDAKREASTADSIREFAQEEIERITNDESSISTRGASKGELKAEVKKKIEKLEKTILFADVYEHYEEKKMEQKLLDYDDLILNVVTALGRDELLLRSLQEKFLYLLIDEHQDTNDAQNLMIRLIADFFESPNIFIVGDEKQAIYRFQGASVENFLKFEKVWPDMKVISLEENYRSHQHILDASFAMIESNYQEGEHKHLRVKLRAGTKKDAAPIDLVEAKDRYSGEAYVIDELKRIQKEQPDKTVAIISRNNKDVDRIVDKVESAGIKIAAERSIDIFNHPIGMLFFSAVAFFDDPLNYEALGKTLVAGLWGVDFEKSVNLLKLLRQGEIAEVVRQVPEIERMRTGLLEDNPMLFLMSLAERSGFLKLLLADPAYVEVWRGIINLSEQIIKQYKLVNPSELLEKLIAYKKSSEGKRIKVSVGARDAKIKAMTAHGSKGLEFDYVFIPYATEESWLPKKRAAFFVLPLTKLEQEGDDVRDARRLFYVALTRARDHAVIVVPREDAEGDLNTPLRFVAELDGHHLTKFAESDFLGERLHDGRDGAHQYQRLIDFTKTLLLERGLSVTALNHYLVCPAEFLLKSILRVPEMQSATSEKGIAMHLAFNRIWNEKLENRTEERIVDTIEETVRESVGKSYLRQNEKDAVIRDLTKTIPQVAKSMLPHFHPEGEVQTEVWKEKHLEIKAGQSTATLRLHGRLDTVIETDNSILAFDYKTKKKMSEAQIKGETANSDGGYFRQLVFYKMLLEDQAKKAGKNIVPSLVFLTPDDKGVCDIKTLDVSEKDVIALQDQIAELVESVWTGEIVRRPCTTTEKGEKCEWCALFELAINK